MVIGEMVAVVDGGGGVCRSRQTRRARWRLRQRSASRRVLPSACLRAREAAGSGARRALLTARGGGGAGGGGGWGGRGGGGGGGGGGGVGRRPREGGGGDRCDPRRRGSG